MGNRYTTVINRARAIHDMAMQSGCASQVVEGIYELGSIELDIDRAAARGDKDALRMLPIVNGMQKALLKRGGYG